MMKQLLWVLLCLVGVGCSREGSDKSEGKLRIATTIEPSASLVRTLGDSLVSVTTLLPAGSTPETYEPSPMEMQALADSKAYMYVGDLGFEKQWLSKIGALYPNLRLINLGKLIADSEHDGGEKHPHEPHYWTSLEGIRAMAQATYEGLIAIDSLHHSVYTTRYTELQQELASLEQELRAQIGQIPSRAFVIYHPSLTYLAHEFGLEQLVIEQDGKEPTPAQLQQTIEQAKSLGVRVVFIQKAFDTKLTEVIAKEIGARSVVIDPLDGDWQQQLRLIVRALTE